jgi:DNA-binding transcriptional ArsR family regulator
MPKHLELELDLVFQALADPTRRAVVERLGEGPGTTSELARPFDMALPSFIQHLGVLERGGLVESEKHGRIRIYRALPRQLESAGDWMAAQRERWSRRLDQLDEYVLGLKERKL